MIRYDHYTDKFVKVSDRECPWCKAVCASTDKYCHECGWHIADTPQRDFPTEWCETCELWQDNNCRGVAVCKRDIESLNEMAKQIEADTPQTDCGWK